MKKYSIEVTEKSIATYIVEADSAEEAEAVLRQGDLNPKTDTIEEYSEIVKEI